MTIVGWDSDGVIYRFTKAYHLWMNLDQGLNLDPEQEAESWTWFENWQTKQQFLDCMDNAVDAGHLFWQGELYEPQIAQNIADLAVAGHQNHLVTHRFSGKTSCSKAATEHFYRTQGITFDSISYSRDKTIVKTDVFLEDNVDNYDALEAAGIKSYLVNRRYNLRKDNRRRVNSVQDFTEMILEGKW